MHRNDNNSMENSGLTRNVFFNSIISGGAAGVVVDFLFFPMDTIKTRLQSQHGFINSGGFKKLYLGLGPVLAGSAPTASLFFGGYECFKEFVQPYVDVKHHTFVHMGAVCTAELISCLVKVPIEVLKQRRQARLANSDISSLGIRTLYRGYGSTLLRDLPFSFIQMPLWEYLKLCWKSRVKRDCTPFEGAIAGSLSVTISAIATTPLDVIKTRIMLTNASQTQVKILSTMKNVYIANGIKGLFAGCTLRAVGLTVSGFFFFGVYEQTKYFCSKTIFRNSSPHSKSNENQYINSST